MCIDSLDHYARSRLSAETNSEPKNNLSDGSIPKRGEPSVSRRPSRWARDRNSPVEEATAVIDWMIEASVWMNARCVPVAGPHPFGEDEDTWPFGTAEATVPFVQRYVLSSKVALLSEATS
jgi:hypothetical protein